MDGTSYVLDKILQENCRKQRLLTWLSIYRWFNNLKVEQINTMRLFHNLVDEIGTKFQGERVWNYQMLNECVHNWMKVCIVIHMAIAHAPLLRIWIKINGWKSSQLGWATDYVKYEWMDDDGNPLPLDPLPRSRWNLAGWMTPWNLTESSSSSSS